MAFNYWQDLEEGGTYHFYNRSVNRERLFIDNQDYAFFLDKTRKYFMPYLDFYAYCLIPNHFHFLVEVKILEESFKMALSKEKTKAADLLLMNKISVNTFLEDQYRRFFSSYALYYNQRYKRSGALFQKRFKRIAVENDVKQLKLLCYIHHNPIHHGLASNYQDWRYSSYSTFLSERPSSINRNKVLEWLGSGNIDIGEAHFMEHHQTFKQPLHKSWMLD